MPNDSWIRKMVLFVCSIKTASVKKTCQLVLQEPKPPKYQQNESFELSLWTKQSGKVRVTGFKAPPSLLNKEECFSEPNYPGATGRMECEEENKTIMPSMDWHGCQRTLKT